MYVSYKKWLTALFVMVLTVLVLPLQVVAAASGTHTPVEGVTVNVSGATDNSMTDGAITVTAKGSAGFFGIGASAKTATITVYNKSGSQAILSFDWDATSVNQLVIDSTTYTGTSGSFSKKMDADASFTATITTAKNGTENKLVMSNFAVATVTSDTKKVTFAYNADYGSVTVAGTAVANGGTVDFDAEAQELNATPKSGYKFLGWVDTTEVAVSDTVTKPKDELMNSAATYSLTATSNMNVTAVFVQDSTAGTAWFIVDGKYLTSDLNRASELGTKIVPVNSGTLAAGDYTIAAGDTLLIPYDASYTLCTTSPTMHDDAYTAPTVYRTLTMASGANITVNGSISVSGSQSSKYQYNGMPSGPLGFIHMNSGSSITVNGGAALYAWGYIKGSGSVTVNDGAKVYECFQIADYRGGNATNAIVGKADTYHVFPFNQFYLQNVEVPMTVYSGASIYGQGAVSVTLVGTKVLNVPFVGPESSMFVLSSGYVVKDYMEGTGRTEIRLYGDLSITEITMNLQVTLGQELNIDTSKYLLPIPQHMTLDVQSGSVTMNQDVAFLPGSELYIREGTTCTLSEGANLYVYDLDQWLYNNGANGYSGTTNLPYVKLKYVPGGDGETGRKKDALIQVDGEADLSAGSAYVTAGDANIYSTGTGVVKVKVPSTTQKAYQVITNGNAIASWPEIPIEPAILQNEVQTEVASVSTTEDGTYTYYASTGRWDKPSHYYESVVTAPTCENAGYTTHTCAVCGDTYTDSDVAAPGHSYESVVTNPTCTEPGKTVHTCAACGDSYEEEIAALGHTPGAEATCTTNQTCTVCGEELNAATGTSHTWVQVLDDQGKIITKCKICGTQFVFQVSMAVNDSLDLIFSVRQSDVAGLVDNLTCTVTKEFADGRENVTQEFSFGKLKPVDGYYRIRFSDISAKEMMDTITAVISYTDNDTEIISCSTSVQGYVHSLYDYYADPNNSIDTENEADNEAKEAAMFKALADLLNYGAACQTHFGYDAENLANTGHDDLMDNATGAAASEYAEAGSEVRTTNAYYYGTSFSAKNNLMFTFYYDFRGEIEPANVSATVIITQSDGSVYKTLSMDTVDWYVRSAGTITLHGIDITGIPLSRGDVIITCELTVDDEVRSTVADSLEAYASRAPEGTLRDTMQALLMFTESANKYFS